MKDGFYKLTKNDLLKITNGIERIEEKEGNFLFRRFTLQEEEYYVKSDWYYPRAFASAGIVIDFITDSSFIHLKGSMNFANSRPFYCCDVLKNGEPIYSITNITNEKDICPSVEGWENKFSLNSFDETINLGSGKKHVEVVFPWSVDMQISEFAVEKNAIIEENKKDKFILFYGDSISQGYDCIHYFSHYTYQVAKSLNANFINKAIAGEIFCPDLIIKNNRKTDLISVAYGTNDTLRISKEEFEKNCYNFYSKLRETYQGVKLCAITPIYRIILEGELPNLNFTVEFSRETINNVANKIQGIQVIDGLKLVDNSVDSFYDKRLHPNEKSAKVYSENLIRFLNL